MGLSSLAQAGLTLTLAVPFLYLLFRSSKSEPEGATKNQSKDNMASAKPPANAPPPPPKDDPFTQEQLKQFDGSNANEPIYVSIKGTVFDVSAKRDTYGSGGSYNIFAGKDASRALGKSTLKAEDAVADYSTLNEQERKTLDEWHSFFGKKYPVVGKVTDMPDAVANQSIPPEPRIPWQ